MSTREETTLKRLAELRALCKKPHGECTEVDCIAVEESMKAFEKSKEWKEEYDNVCKFANGYEEERDELRAAVAVMKGTFEAIERHLDIMPNDHRNCRVDNYEEKKADIRRTIGAMLVSPSVKKVFG